MIPLSTTTITVLRQGGSPYDEPYGPPNTTEIASGVRAVIDVAAYGAGAGVETQAGGEMTRTALRLLCDVCDLTSRDWVRDDNDGVVYRVVWLLRHGRTHSLEHIQAGIELVEGVI